MEIIAGSELTMSELRSSVVETMIRGYHEYQSIWEAEIGENLTCIREPGNVRDPYAVAVTKPKSSTYYSWTRPKKNVSYMFALSLKRRQYLSKMAC